MHPGEKSEMPPVILPAEVIEARTEPPQARHLLTKRLLAAFVIAAVSDAVSFWTEFAPPVQWVVDLATALALFLILGRRWAILPALVAEAIPGLAVFPIWLLVVLSIFLYDDIKGPRRARVV